MRKIYTVTMINRMEEDFEPWTASFDSRQRAEEFMAEIRELIPAGHKGHWRIALDVSFLNGTYYYDAMKNYFEEEE